MITEINYFDIATNEYLFSEPLSSEGYIFIPNEGDVFFLEGWGYQISRREYSYENNKAKITIICTKERKKR